MKVTKLYAAYADQSILEDINFELKSHLSILGANGSGKSTLAKALCGLLEYEGSIRLNGQELREIPAIERAKSIAYIPAKMQSYELFTTVEDFVLLGRYPYKQSFKDYSQDDKELVQTILNELNIAHLKQQALHQLSSGEQQLTLIAQALAQESKILIFDEPTANLDPKNTALFVKELQKLRQNHTTILITHDIQLASFFNDAVLFIQDKQAHYYKHDFFKTQTLKEAYGIDFTSSNGLIGVAYD